MAESAPQNADAPPVIELRKVSKTFGEVRSLRGCRVPGQSARNCRAARRQRRRQVDAHQSGDGLSYPRRRRRDLFPRQARRREVLVGGQGALARHRDRLSGTRAVRETADMAQHVHGARAAHAVRLAGRRAHAQRMRAADERAYGLHLGGGASQQCRRHHVGRREAGRRNHPRTLFRGRAGHSR